eukprot:scaffold108903_cov69-Phaeocystis_antarctica.AAC.7
MAVLETAVPRHTLTSRHRQAPQARPRLAVVPTNNPVGEWVVVVVVPTTHWLEPLPVLISTFLEAARLDVGLPVESISKGEGPPIVIREDVLRARHGVANGVGGVLALRLRDLAGHVVRHVAPVVQVDLLDAERVVQVNVGCGARPGLPDPAGPKVDLHQAPVDTVLDRRDGVQHVPAGHLGHDRRVLRMGVVAALLAERTAGDLDQRDLVHFLLAERADGDAVRVLERAALDLEFLREGDDSRREASVANPREEEERGDAEGDHLPERELGDLLGREPRLSARFLLRYHAVAVLVDALHLLVLRGGQDRFLPHHLGRSGTHASCSGADGGPFSRGGRVRDGAGLMCWPGATAGCCGVRTTCVVVGARR